MRPNCGQRDAGGGEKNNKRENKPMFLNTDKIENAIFGAVDSHKTENGAKYFKCTQKSREAWKKRSEGLYNNSIPPTGIRLDFETNSDIFAFKAITNGEFDILINGKILCRTGQKELLPSGESRCFHLEKGEKRITLAFPSHNCGVEFCGITLSDGASFKPHEYDGKILFIGDSITQGWNSVYNSLSFAWQTMLRLNADCVVNGIGGAVFAEETFDDIDFDPDTVIVAYGTNDYCGGSSLDTISDACEAFLKKVRVKYADKRVVVILPVWSKLYDEPKEWGTMDECREIIKNHADGLGFEVLNGDGLVPHSEDFYFDEVHPNSLGFCLYANGLIDFLNKKGRD